MKTAHQELVLKGRGFSRAAKDAFSMRLQPPRECLPPISPQWLKPMLFSPAYGGTEVPPLQNIEFLDRFMPLVEDSSYSIVVCQYDRASVGSGCGDSPGIGAVGGPSTEVAPNGFQDHRGWIAGGVS